MKNNLIAALITLLVIALFILGAFAIKLERRSMMVDSIADCYEENTQCGIHNILEEVAYEDVNLEWTEWYIAENFDNLIQPEKGLEIVSYLKSLSMAERTKLLSEGYDLYVRRNMP